MNAYQEFQNSGIHWPDRLPANLRQSVQAPTRWPEQRQRAPILYDVETQMAHYVVQHEALLKKVRRHYVLPVDGSVRDFLDEHRAVLPILLEAAPQLLTYFGTSAIFHLRAPIDEAGSRTLYAVAVWHGRLCDVRDALARFDCCWWMARASQAAGYLTFTYELV